MSQDLLLEIGTEELPAVALMPALDEMKSLFAAKAAELRLTHGDIATYGTPRDWRSSRAMWPKRRAP